MPLGERRLSARVDRGDDLDLRAHVCRRVMSTVRRLLTAQPLPGRDQPQLPPKRLSGSKFHNQLGGTWRPGRRTPGAGADAETIATPAGAPGRIRTPSLLIRSLGEAVSGRVGGGRQACATPFGNPSVVARLIRLQSKLPSAGLTMALVFPDVHRRVSARRVAMANAVLSNRRAEQDRLLGRGGWSAALPLEGPFREVIQ
jgi:hypothetical protein